jgi:O-antigen/teichoic acid export membrane protein
MTRSDDPRDDAPPPGPAPAKATAAGAPAADAAHAARSGIAQLVGALAQLAMPVYHVLVARLFGQAVFGLYQTSLAVMDLCTRLGWMGGDRAMHRFIAAHRAAGEDEMAQRAFGGALRLTATVSFCIAVALVFSSGLIARLLGKPGLAQMLPIMALFIVPATCTMVLVAATLGNKVVRVNLLVRSAGEPIFMISCALVAFALGGGPRRLAAAHLTASTLGFIGALVGAGFVFGRAWVARALRSPRHPGLVRFVLPIAGSEVGNTVLQKADLFILSRYASEGTIAIYAASEFLGRVAANVRYAFDSVAAPVLSEALHLRDRERLRYNLSLMTRWVVTLSVPLAVAVVGLRGDLLAMYGAGFAGGATLVCIWTATHLVNGSFGLVSHVLTMSGRSRAYFFNQVVAAATNVVLSLILIPRFGMIGAAVSALISVTLPLILAVLEVWIAERVHPFDRGLVKPFVAGAGMLLAEVGVAHLVTERLARVLAVIFAGLASYLGLLFLLGPGREEKEIVQRIWTRLRRPPT